MRDKLRSPLGIVAIGAMVFATVFAAASSLTVGADLLPQSGSDVTLPCDADGVSVGYNISAGAVTGLVVSGIDCATGSVSLVTTAAYTFVEGPTQNSAGTVTYTLGAVAGAALPIPVALFVPGTVTVTLVP